MMHTAIIAEILYYSHQDAARAHGFGALNLHWNELAEETRALWIDTVKHARARGLEL